MQCARQWLQLNHRGARGHDIAPGTPDRGTVTERARGEYKFNWDPIFIPDGFEQTYGQMGLEMKRLTSPVAKAWAEFLTAEFGTREKARHDAAPHARR